MNSQWFSRKEVEKGLHLQFIKNLNDISNAKENGYFEILISSDGEATCVEGLERDYKGEDCEGRFVHLDYDEVVMKEVHFPDNHYEYLFENEVDLALKKWLKEHPTYKKNQYGMWYDENEGIAGDTNKIEEQNNLKPNGIEGTSDTTITAKQMSLEDFGIKIE